jgi:large subunit ribosomal protein L22
MEVRAVAKWLRLSPRKARLVTALIRGRSAEDALYVLANADKAAAVPIGKTLRSAIANAENDPRNQVTLENLYVKDARADEGPRRKFIWMRGRGRRDLKVHRMTHITVIVDEREPEPTRPRRRTAATTATAPRTARPSRRPLAAAPEAETAGGAKAPVETAAAATAATTAKKTKTTTKTATTREEKR